MEPHLFVLQMRILPRGKVLSKLTQQVRKSWEQPENRAEGSFLRAEMRASLCPLPLLHCSSLECVFHVPGGKTKARPARALLPPSFPLSLPPAAHRAGPGPGPGLGLWGVRQPPGAGAVSSGPDAGLTRSLARCRSDTRLSDGPRPRGAPWNTVTSVLRTVAASQGGKP